jgi:hypothetical protein
MCVCVLGCTRWLTGVWGVQEYSFFTSTFDLLMLAVARFVVLAPLAWDMRRLASPLGRTAATLVTVASIGFAVAKLIKTDKDDIAGGAGFAFAMMAATCAFALGEVAAAIFAPRLVAKAVERAAAEAAAVAAAAAANGTAAGGPPKPTIKLNRATLGRMLALAKPEWKLLTVGMVALVLSSFTQLALPFVFGRLVDALSAADDPNRQLAQSVVVLVIISAVGSFFSFVRGWFFTLAGQRVRPPPSRIGACARASPVVPIPRPCQGLCVHRSPPPFSSCRCVCARTMVSFFLSLSPSLSMCCVG